MLNPVKLDGVAPLVADPFYANFTTDTSRHPLSDIGDTWSTLSIWLNRQIVEEDDQVAYWI